MYVSESECKKKGGKWEAKDINKSHYCVFVIDMFHYVSKCFYMVFYITNSMHP